jgi:hypothetical protein
MNQVIQCLLTKFQGLNSLPTTKKKKKKEEERGEREGGEEVREGGRRDKEKTGL